MQKKIYIDLETTGVDPQKNGIIQIAAIIAAGGAISEEINFSANVAPFGSDIIEDEALRVNGKTKEEILSYKDPMGIYGEFIDLLSSKVDRYNKKDKFTFVGYNSRFDCDFLRAWFTKCGNPFFGSYFFFPPIDVMNLAAHTLQSDRHTLLNFKLGTVAAHLGIAIPEGEALHDAMTDIRLTMQIEQELHLRLKSH